MHDISPIKSFLYCETPQAWVVEALKSENLPTLLIDHANCELKAAQTAQGLMWKYRGGVGGVAPGNSGIQLATRNLHKKLSQLAREELLHFEQVLEFMDAFDVVYDNVPASRYARELRQHIRTREPHRLVDTLIIGGIIEARSCERFAVLSPLFVEREETAALGRYYAFLLKSESRHFEDYLLLASSFSSESIDERVGELLTIEASLIESEDSEFRFHSGVYREEAALCRQLEVR